MAGRKKAPVGRRRKPTLHFIFAAHTGDRTARVLRPVLARAERKGQKLAFLGMEMVGIRAAEKRKLEREQVACYDREHTRHMGKLASEYRLPMRLVEASRPRQFRKIRKLPRFPAWGLSVHKMNFKTAISYHTDGFYKLLNKFLARHDEVRRNLRKEIRSIKPDETGIVVYGPYHKGLDRFIASELGVKTRRTSEKQPYRTINDEVMGKCFSKPRERKPSKDELAQIALESLLDLCFIPHAYEEEMLKQRPNKEIKAHFKKFHALRRLIKTLSYEQIEAGWERIRAHELAQTRALTVPEKVQRVDEVVKLLESTFGK